MQKKGVYLHFLGFLFGVATLLAQPPTDMVEGLHHNTPRVLALTHAVIHGVADETVEDGTLIVRDGIIEAVGSGIEIPADAVVIDLKGRHLYPGFIEPAGHVGMPTMSGDDKASRPAGASYWNSAIHAEKAAADLFELDSKAVKKFRDMGFTAMFTVPDSGLVLGRSALVHLGEDPAPETVLAVDTAMHVNFSAMDGDQYPDSLMGTVALLRQFFSDGAWYGSLLRSSEQHDLFMPERNRDLAAVQPFLRDKLVVFQADSHLDVHRVADLAEEHGFKAMVVGIGDAFADLSGLAQRKLPLALSLNFPKAPDVTDPFKAEFVSLQELLAWYTAPAAPAAASSRDLTFAFTAGDVEDSATFLRNLRKTIVNGLPKDKALAALTSVPAKMLGVDHLVGSLEAGKQADFLLSDGDLFENGTLLETWVAGKRYPVSSVAMDHLAGVYKLRINGKKAEITLPPAHGSKGDLKLSFGKNKAETQAFSRDQNRISFLFKEDKAGFTAWQHIAIMEKGGQVIAELRDTNARLTEVALEKSGDFKSENHELAKLKADLSALPKGYPLGAFSRQGLPERPGSVLVKNATLWTAADAGILENADLLIVDGKIAQIGQNLEAGADLVIDAEGKHVTPGIIDEHSHTAADAINEGTSAITSECGIEDVLNPTDISIYRQLAGGVTTVSILHGSANPIGGRNAVLKWRWGGSARDMLYENSMPGIKFALGENVKQSNWGEEYTTRYPQTRMGVDQFFRDAFNHALDYRRARQAYENADDKSKLTPPRRNYRYDVLLEILDGKRQIHCHSYRQDEIIALMRVAEEIGFKIDVFTHILEGYKVADEMKAHGAMASTFADWWAYKFEVFDAITYNAKLMHDQGVVVSFNSDDDEMARRLNVEAAKAVRYGGVPPEEAIKFVTLNPAKQLRIDAHTGSLEKGKEADFVIWSASPLSTYAMAEQTWIDGRRYFDRDEDKAAVQQAEKSRRFLIAEVLKATAMDEPIKSDDEEEDEEEHAHYSCRKEASAHD